MVREIVLTTQLGFFWRPFGEFSPAAESAVDRGGMKWQRPKRVGETGELS